MRQSHVRLFFRRPESFNYIHERLRTPRSTLVPLYNKGEVRRHTDAQAGILLAEASSAICVQRFDGSRIVQITLRIAFRCVLHRCESQDIHCWELFRLSFFLSFFLTKRGDKKVNFILVSYIGCVWEGEDAHFKGVWRPFPCASSKNNSQCGLDNL